MSGNKRAMYKVLSADLRSAHGGEFDWAPYIDGTRTPAIENVQICRRGYHITPDPMAWPLIGMRVFEVAQAGKGWGNGDKVVVPWVELGPERPDLVPGYWHDVEVFVEHLASVPWFSPQGAPDPAWRVFDTRDAAWDAAWDAVRDAAWDAAWGAAWDAVRPAAWDAARAVVIDAARIAAEREAWDAVWAAVGDTARDAVWGTAWDATWSATLYAAALACEWRIGQGHIDHIKARWAVWEHGYGVLCDCEGSLYVYRRP